MAHSSEDFTFTLKIENFSMLPQQTGEHLSSAAFIVEKLSHSKWYLLVYPKGYNKKDFIYCFLFSRDSIGTSNQIDVLYTLESTDASFNRTERTHLIKRENGVNYACHEFNASTLYKDKHLYLPQDIFTLRCCITPLDNAPPNNYKPIIVPNYFNKHCSSVIRIKVVKRSFTWSITKIGKLIGSRGKTSLKIKSVIIDSPSLELSFCFNNNSNEENVKESGDKSIEELNEEHVEELDEEHVEELDEEHVEELDEEHVEELDEEHVEELDKECLQAKEDLQNSDKEYVKVEIRQTHLDNNLFVKCKMTVLSANKQYQHSKEDTHLFSSNLDEVWCFPAFILKKNLVDDKYIYIDDTLLLQCDFAFSHKPVNNTDYNVAEVPQYIPWNFRNKKASKVNELKGSIRHLYLNEKLCDVSIQAGSKTFPAHKIILCARSSVFSAMFETDMKEKNTNVVEIADVEPHTLDRFLKFLHSDILEEDMTLEDTCKLYSAADKYQVFLLKQQCSILLLSTLSVASVCDVLVLADAHSDPFLLTVVHNFLRSHSTESFHSAKWKNYKERYPKLFGDIMIKIFMEE